ncbi:MAG: hypothetical protein KY428_09215, partial [Bacteroidetes bacterium]|nr:hypothetical protein [Bacteroidota bacterium]
GGFSFDLHQLRLEQVRLRFADDSSSMNLNVRAPYLLAELETLGLEEQFIKISKVDIRDLQGSFRQLTANISEDTLATAPETAQALDSAFLNPSGFHVTVDDFTVKNTQFHFQTSKLARQGTLNFENLDLRNINIGIQDFYLAGDTLKLKVAQLAAIDRTSGFVLDNIAMDVALEMPMFSGSLHEVITPHTRLTDEIRIEQVSLKPGADMLASMQLSANIKDAALSMEDAAFFTPALDTLPQVKKLTLLLDLDARVADNQATISPMHLRTSDGGLNLRASGEASGLNNLNTVRFDMRVQELSTTVNYLEQFSFVPPLPAGAQQAGRLNLIAQAKGTPSNVDATARLRSGAGLLETNMLYRAPTGSRFILTGNIDATNFNLSPFVGDSLGLGAITLSSKMRIDGKGQQIDVERFSLLIDSVAYNDYTYKGLAAEGFFVDSVMEAVAAYEDPYLSFDLLARSDLKDSLPLMHAELNLGRINMYRLNLSPDSIIFSSKIVADVRGQDPDQIEGEVVIRDTEAIRGAESWTMDSLIMVSTKEPSGEREISMTSDFATLSLSGTYLFKNLQNVIDQFASHYYTAYMPNEDMVEYNQNIKLEINMWDEPAIAKAFLPQLELLHPMTLKAVLRDTDRSFDLDMNAPGISWADSIIIRNLVIDAKTEDRVMSFDVGTDKIQLGGLMDIPEFKLDGQWRQDSIQFELGLAPSSDSTRFIMAGDLTFWGDTTALALNKTELALKGQEYEMANNATIKLASDYLYVNNLSLGRDNQLLSINTAQETGPDPLLIAEIEHFQISDFMEVLGLTELGLAASLDGRVQLTQPMNISAIEADLLVNNLMVDSLPVGNIKAEMNKVSTDGRINANIALNGPNNDLSLDGFFNVEDSTNAMGLNIAIKSFNLEPWEPFVKEFMTDISGILQGNIEVGGSVNQPKVDGSIGFSEN